MHNVIGWLIILSVLVWPVVQMFVLLRWRGIWRFLASIPILVGVGGCAYYFVKQSNMWPFWLVVVAPYCTVFLLLLWGVHFVKHSR